MNEDYLWDKSGEPDPQIQELEEILAPLRYQPKPLVVRRKRNYVPLLAIAATIVIALLVGGIWLSLREEQSIPPQEAKSAPPVLPEVVRNTDSPNKPIRRRKRNFSKHDREEALAAKEQVMAALRLASEKLKLAQRKTNQHKVG